MNYTSISFDLKRKKAGQIPLFYVSGITGIVINQIACEQTPLIIPPFVRHVFMLFSVPAITQYSLVTGHGNLTF